MNAYAEAHREARIKRRRRGPWAVTYEDSRGLWFFAGYPRIGGYRWSLNPHDVHYLPTRRFAESLAREIDRDERRVTVLSLDEVPRASVPSQESDS